MFSENERFISIKSILINFYVFRGSSFELYGEKD